MLQYFFTPFHETKHTRSRAGLQVRQHPCEVPVFDAARRMAGSSLRASERAPVLRFEILSWPCARVYSRSPVACTASLLDLPF
jgi:hypothetical protein